MIQRIIIVISILLFVFAGFALFFATPALATDYYFSTSGVDDDDGGGGSIYCRHEGNDVVVSRIWTTPELTENTWQKFRFAWSVTNNEISVKVDAGSWYADIDADTVTAFTTNPTQASIGEDSGISDSIADEVYLDEVYIYGKYQHD